MLTRRRLIVIVFSLMILVFAVAYFSSDANHDNGSKTEVQVQEKPKVIRIGPVSPDIIAFSITEGRVEHGKQIPYVPEKHDIISQEGNNLWLARNGRSIGSIVGRVEKYIMTFDRFVGEKLDITLIEKPENFSISSTDDPDLSTDRQPYAVFRKTRPTDFARIGTTFEAPLEHTIYMKLIKPLKAGKQYTIEFKQLDIPKQTFIYEPTKMRSEAVHISHIGFRPDDPSKVAFLSLWLGDGGSFDFKEKTPFFVLDNKSGDTVFKGEVILSKKMTEKDEDAYGHNFNGVNVYFMDFSPFRKPGKYRIYVEGTGCSYPFDIEDDVWSKSFYVSARGLYHQRSGMELRPPYTTFKRPRNFYPDDGVKIYASTAKLMDTSHGLEPKKSAFTELVKGKTSEVLPNAWGGYCDAGDWDRRIQHLITARYLFELFDFSPKYFDKFDLNIPGSKEEFPDIIREALWGIDFFRRLQTLEGGVRGGIESEDHPKYGETSWQESLTVMAFAPDIYSSYIYAGSAAYSAYVLRKYNFKMSDIYSDSAIKAMKWAEKEINKTKTGYPYQVNDIRNLAAAELFRLTGMKNWHDLFMETTVFKGKETLLYKHDNYDQSDAAWVYYNTDKKGTDKNIKQKCKSAIIYEAEKLIEAQRKTGFKWAQNPWRPAIAGTFTTPDCKNIVRAHAITGKRDYLQAIILAAQAGAGANPLNICYTTGIGYKNPKNPMHVDARITHQLPPPGITVFGPLDVNTIGGPETYSHKLVGQFCYPNVKSWPIIESYFDVFWYPEMCEFTVLTSIAPNAYIWGYLAVRK